MLVFECVCFGLKNAIQKVFEHSISCHIVIVFIITPQKVAMHKMNLRTGCHTQAQRCLNRKSTEPKKTTMIMSFGLHVTHSILVRSNSQHNVFHMNMKTQ